MAGIQLLRLQVNERLEAAVEEIFGLVEQTIAGYEDEAVRSKREIYQLKKQLEQLTVLKLGVKLFRADQKIVSEEVLPSLEPCVIKMEQEQAQVKWEQVDQHISPDLDADTYDAEDAHPQSEQTTNFEMLPSSTAVTASVNESFDQEWIESDGPSSPHQNQSSEVVVELEQPPREENSCHCCGESFLTDTHLIRHMRMSHKKHKAFKCTDCNKEFEYRYLLDQHRRVHTGEKPFSCDYCNKTFAQNSGRLVHMRTHTGEKPYFCKNCGKRFTTSKHLKICKLTQERGKVDETEEEEKPFKCLECNKKFFRKHELILHVRVHTGEKPFSCEFCGKTFASKSNCSVHMRVHTGDAPFYCKKCGRKFKCGKHAKYCKGTQEKVRKKYFCCKTCGKSFYTDSDLKLHTEVHESWKLHISEKLQGQE